MINQSNLNAYFDALLPEAMEHLRGMVEVNSWTDNPAGVNRVGDITAALFAPLGFRSERVPSTNPNWGAHLVLTRPGGSSRTLAMVSHLDTVFPPEEEQRNAFRWQPEGDRIFGPGTHDIKGGTVMMWMVLRALSELAPEIFSALGWKLFLNSSEETLSADFGEVCLQRLDAGTIAALVFEAEGRRGQVRRLVVARKGRATWRVRLAGRGAHAGGKHAHGANAIVEAARVVRELASLTDYTRHLTFNVAEIQGGCGLNRVPHEAQVQGEFRCFAPEVFAEARARLLSLSGPGSVAAPADGFRCAVSSEILHESRPWPRNEGSDRLLNLWRAQAESLGMALEGEERGGLSDGNLLCHAFPTIDGLGPYGDNDHCSERSADGTKLPEYVERSSFTPKATLNTLAILELARQNGLVQSV